MGLKRLAFSGEKASHHCLISPWCSRETFHNLNSYVSSKFITPMPTSGVAKLRRSYELDSSTFEDINGANLTRYQPGIHIVVSR